MDGATSKDPLGAPRPARSSVYATLEVEGARVLLHLVPDPARTSRALAHAHGFAISHLDGQLAAAVSAHLGPLRRALSSLGADEIPEHRALSRIARACGAAIPGARLVVRRRLPPDQRTPRWPVTLRSGSPSAAGGGIWPYDAELAGLRLGLRRLLLRESVMGARADADAAWLTGHGLAVRCVAGSDAPGTSRIFAATSPAILDEVADRHAAACAGGAGFRDAARWMGAALGYPTCCVEAFLGMPTRDDLTLFAERVPPLPHRPASPLVGWLNGAVTLLSHVPCAPDCAPSHALAAAILAELERGSPGFADRWRALAARLQVLTAAGRCFAIAAAGDLVADGRVQVTDAVELVPPPDDDPAHVLVPAPDLPGRELRVERGLLVAPDLPGWAGTLVADHRG